MKIFQILNNLPNPHAATPLELVLVIPVHNEQDVIVQVLEEWRAELGKTVGAGRFLILVIDDGSTDGTPVSLARVEWPELRVIRHTNRGHGQSCLAGYIEAARLGAAYVFQVDSDGQCDPSYFAKVWSMRGSVAAVYGRRTTRDDGFGRRLISGVLRFSLKLARRTRLNDSNVPYRLYAAEFAAGIARRVPADFNLANIAVALLAEPSGFAEIPIHFRARIGGMSSVRWWGFAAKALQLHRDLFKLGR